METRTILSGIAGEYFVAGELSRRGYIASITLRNTASIDILASNGEKTVNIQVKTKCIERAKSWDMGSKPLECKEVKDNIFYVFVEISSEPNNKELSYHIIPKKELNRRVEENFQEHIKEPRRNGDPRPRITTRRRFLIEEYPEFQKKDNWDILFS